MLIANRRETDLKQLTLRQQVALALRILESHGIADNAAGHITVRVPGTDSWWTNPWNYEWSTLRTSDLVRLDASGQVLEGETEPSPFLDLHFLLYQHRPELNCVIHNHPYYLCLYAALEKPLLVLDQQASLFFENHLVYNEYKGLALGADINRPTVAAMGNFNTALLKSHGLVTCAESLDSAVYLAVYAERTAKHSWEAQQHPAFNPETDQMQPEVARQTRDAILGRKIPIVQVNWEAWVRQTLRLSPDVLE